MRKDKKQTADLIIKTIREHVGHRISYAEMARVLGVTYSAFYGKTPDAQNARNWKMEDIVRVIDRFGFTNEEILKLFGRSLKGWHFEDCLEVLTHASVSREELKKLIECLQDL